MADIRINSLPTTASASSSDDFLALDGATNGTRKLNAYSPTFGGNLTVSGSANLISSSLNSYIYDGTGWVWTSTGTSGGTVKGGIYTAGGQLFITANSSLATNRFSLNSSGDATLAGNLTVNGNVYGGSNLVLYGTTGATGNVYLRAQGAGYVRVDTGSGFRVESGSLDVTAGNLTVSGSIVNQNGIIQSTLAAGALISSLSTNNNAVHGFQISGSGTGSRDWRLEQGRAGANSFSISNATGGLTTPLIVNGATDNILIGCSSASSDSGNGKLQLATGAADKTSGIGFSSDTSLYRYQGGRIALDHLGGSLPVFSFLTNGTTRFSVYANGTTGTLETSNGSIQLATSGAIALTLDTSQNATFAGKVAIGGGTAIAKVVSVTSTDNYSTLTATSSTNVDVAVSGCTTTDAVIVNPADGSPWPNGLIVNAFVVSTGYVRIWAYNSLSSNLAVGSRTVRVTTIKY